MEQSKSNTTVAGIDAAKAKLDIAAHGREDIIQVTNTTAGFERLGPWLKALGITRVGIEATGGYERAVVVWLEQQGYEVVVHQPREIRLFARFKRIKAKNDRMDARVIAAATAQVDTVKAAGDPLLRELAERLTAYEQAADLLAQLKTCFEHVTLPDLRAQYQAQARQLAAWKKALAKDLVARIGTRPDLARRFDLVMSLPGVGQIIAASLIIRMPELGQMARGQATSLIGVAPFDRDTGQSSGQRHIWGGRSRPRRMLYLAAIVAKRIDPAHKAFALRLTKAGKKPKVVIVAVMRKIIEAANLVLGRGTPWVPTSPA